MSSTTAPAQTQESLVGWFLTTLHKQQCGHLLPYDVEDKNEYRSKCLGELTAIASQLTDFSKVDLFQKMNIDEKDAQYISYWIIASLGGEQASIRERRERLYDLKSVFEELNEYKLEDALTNYEKMLIRRFTSDESEGDKFVG